MKYTKIRRDSLIRAQDILLLLEKLTKNNKTKRRPRRENAIDTEHFDTTRASKIKISREAQNNKIRKTRRIHWTEYMKNETM